MNRLCISKKRFKFCVLATVMTITSADVTADELQTLRNLERERAQVIDTLLDPDLVSEQRRARIDGKTRRLVDLERMVIRDPKLEGHTHNMVKRAFADFDLTFLAHASVEQNAPIAGHWFAKVGLGNKALMRAQRGIR